MSGAMAGMLQATTRDANATVVRHEGTVGLVITPETAQALHDAGFDEVRVADLVRTTFEGVLRTAASLPLDTSARPAF
jgi:pyruvate formate-lyase activating enzyme-like uncharacterized protein